VLLNFLISSATQIGRKHNAFGLESIREVGLNIVLSKDDISNEANHGSIK
jgi:hypothetical protein